MQSSLLTAVASSLLYALVFVAPAEATFPGRNGKIVFSGVADPKKPLERYLYTVNPTGSGLKKIGGGPGASDPAWSPNMRRVVFARRPGSSRADVYIMSSKGGGVKRLTRFPGAEDKPAWLPDNRTISVAPRGIFEAPLAKFIGPPPCAPLRRGDCDEIHENGAWTVGANGTGLTDLTAKYPQCRVRPTPTELIEGGHLVKRCGGFGGFGTVWSPDGRKIAAFTPLDGVYVHNTDGTGQIGPIPPSVTTWLESSYPDWSPDSRRIVFLGDKPPLCAAPGCGAIYTAAANGTDVRLVIAGKRVIGEAVWSPDGRKIALTLKTPGRRAAIYVIAPNGTGLRRLTPRSMIAQTADWGRR